MAIEMVKQLVGQIVTITSVGGYSICFSNDLGGTREVSGTFRVKIVKQWHDYETGWRFVGTVLDQADKDRLMVAGETGHRTTKGYAPDTVYFSDDVIQP